MGMFLIRICCVCLISLGVDLILCEIVHLCLRRSAEDGLSLIIFDQIHLGNLKSWNSVPGSP